MDTGSAVDQTYKLETSPDRAGSYRICRRELRLPIPDLALCRVVEEKPATPP